MVSRVICPLSKLPVSRQSFISRLLVSYNRSNLESISADDIDELRSMTKFSGAFSWIAVLLIAVTMVAFSHLRIARFLEKTNHANDLNLIPPPDAVKLCALGYDQLLADLYWLGFVQYIGDLPARKKDKSRLAEKYLDLITGLDPHFVQAYWYAAFSIGSECHEPDRADILIRRGIDANQDNWYLPFIGGINQYLYAHNDAAAARYYEMAAKFPDAPKWLERQAKLLEAKIPQSIKQINTWDNIYRSESDPLVRDRAKANLVYLWTHVYRTADSKIIKEKAKNALEELGIKSAP